MSEKERRPKRTGRHPALFVGVAAILLISALIAFGFKQRVEWELTKSLEEHVQFAVAILDPENIEALSASDIDNSDPGYLRLREQFSKILGTNHIELLRWFYLMRVDDGKAVFLLDSADIDDPGHSEPGVPYYEPPEAIFGVASDGRTRFVGPYTDEYGSYYSVFAPVRNRNGGIIAVMGGDIEAAALDSEGLRRAVPLFAGTGFATAFFIVCYVILLRWSIKLKEAQETAMQVRLRSLTDELLAGLYIIQDGVFVYVNPAFVKMFGYKEAKEIIGKPWQDFATKMGEAAVVKSGIAQRMSGSGNTVKYVFEGKRKDGGTFYPEVLSTSGTYEGRPAVIGSMVDVSDRMRAEEKVKELDQLKSKFIQIVSHQFRTPLNAVRWNLETLMAEELGKLADTQKDFIRLTHDSAVTVIRRLGDLLTALDIEEGKITLDRDSVDIASIAVTVLHGSKKLCELKEISCRFVPTEDDIPGITADAEKIRTVVEKLVENAVFYSDAGNEVTVKIEKKKDMIRVAVADKGIGIPKTEQKRLFTRFFRASNASTKLPDSSGLGLCIAKYFVEAHGGKIDFMSVEGKGSTFWFELPITG